MEEPALEKSIISDDVREELAVFRALKPYIGHCLTLNHDINNPLAGIIGYGEFLMEESKQLDETQRGYLQQVLDCAERIRKLVENLCEEKIALNEKIDLKSVSEAYQRDSKPLEK
ncbi:MAG: histidine kinase dimerization/phospho-acceptor domain-containing protein [bacterium]